MLTYSRTADEVQDSASHIVLISRSLGRDLIEKGAEEIPFLPDRVHIAWNNCIRQGPPMWAIVAQGSTHSLG